MARINSYLNGKRQARKPQEVSLESALRRLTVIQEDWQMSYVGPEEIAAASNAGMALADAYPNMAVSIVREPRAVNITTTDANVLNFVIEE